MKRHLAAGLAALTMTAGLVVAPAPAEARGLCWLGICGVVQNSPKSHVSIGVKCGNGSWHSVAPGKSSTSRCKDANGFRVGTKRYTYRAGKNSLGGLVWMRLAPGFHEVHDGQTYYLKRI
jgi:hypothetical protein